MREYKFRVFKEDTLIIPAENEGEAWIELLKLNPDLLGLEWKYDLIETPQEALSSQFQDPLETAYAAEFTLGLDNL
jgi:hypothetical protein